MSASPSTDSKKRKPDDAFVARPSLKKIALRAVMEQAHLLTTPDNAAFMEFLVNKYCKAFAFAIMTPIRDCDNLWRTLGNIMMTAHRYNGVEEGDLKKYTLMDHSFKNSFGAELLEKHGLRNAKKVQMTAEQMRNHFTELYRCSGGMVEILTEKAALPDTEGKSVLRKVGAIAEEFVHKVEFNLDERNGETKGLAAHVEREYEAWHKRYGAYTEGQLKPNIEFY